MNKIMERLMQGIFLICGLITVACVLVITVYLLISGIPAIREIGLISFLFGKTWASTAKDASFGILPFILTSIYGTAGAIVLGVPVGFFTAVYLSKFAPEAVKQTVSFVVSLLASIPSVVYGLVGMMALVPAVRKLFHIPDGASLFAAIIVLAVMMVSGNVANMPKLLGSVRFLTTAVASEMSYAAGLQRQALFSIALVLYFFIMLINAALRFFSAGKGDEG